MLRLVSRKTGRHGEVHQRTAWAVATLETEVAIAVADEAMNVEVTAAKDITGTSLDRQEATTVEEDSRATWE